MKSLADLCVSEILKNHGLYRPKLSLLPQELQDEVAKQKFQSEYQCVGGKWYSRQEVVMHNSDWGNYKS